MARPIQKLEPSEKGNTKDRRPSSRSQRWKRCEREDSRWLRDHDGVDPVMARVATSTGRLGHITYMGLDTSSLHYVGETKARKLPQWVIDAWTQINQIALDRKDRAPILFLHPGGDNETTFVHDGKSHRLPTMHVMTEERHRHLLECEARCEELDSNG